MRKTIAIAVLLALAVLSASAQNNTNRIGLGVGITYAPGAEATLFWEHETSYHNTWEVFAKGRQSLSGDPAHLWEGTRSWCVGAAWKPCLFRARNRYGSARIGASLGAAPTQFQAGIHAGWQHSYALRRGWQFYWSAGVDLLLPRRDDLLRAGVGVGFKIPVRDRLRY